MRQFAAPRGAQSEGSSGRSWLGQALHNKIIAVVLTMIVAVPLLAAPADYSLTGLAALTLEAFALVLMVMLLWRSKWDLRPQQLSTFVKTSANVPLLLLVGWVAISCFLSPYKIFSIQYLLQVGAGAMLYFAVTYQFRQSKHLSMLADVLLALALVVSIGGLVGYQMYDQERASAFYGNAQPLGSLVMLLLPVVAALAIGDKKAKRQVIAQIALVLMVGCLLLTQVRSAWMGSVAGLAMLAFLASRVSERMEEKSLRRQQAANGSALSSWKTRKDQFVLPAMLAVLAVGFVLVMNTQNGNVAQRTSTLSQLGTDMSWQSRVGDSWKGALTMIEQRPLTGWGAGLFPFYQHQFTNQGTTIDPSGTGVRISLAEQAHNFYLQTTAELGLVGLGLMLAVLVCFWAAAWRRIPTMEAGIRRTLLMAATAASVSFAFDAVGSPSWQYAQNSMFLWLMLGIGTSCLRPRLRQETEAETAQILTRRATWVARPAAVGLFLVLTTLLPTAYSTAQAQTYNNPTSTGGGVFKVALGVSAVAAAGYGLYAILVGAGIIAGDDDDDKEKEEMTIQPAPSF